MSNSQVFTVTGAVLENLPNAMFRVRVNDPARPELHEKVVLGYLSGKARLHYVRLLPGDQVKCEMSPLDLSKARITFKLNK